MTTQMTLTKTERAAVVHWLNGRAGDNDYFIQRPTGNTHLKRTTFRVAMKGWKVRIAYEADSGFPVATGQPFQAEKSGRHEDMPGAASIPASEKAKVKAANTSPWGYATQKPSYSTIGPDIDPAYKSISVLTKGQYLYLPVPSEYATTFVKEYNLVKALKAQHPNVKLTKVANKDLYRLSFKAQQNKNAFEQAVAEELAILQNILKEDIKTKLSTDDWFLNEMLEEAGP